MNGRVHEIELKLELQPADLPKLRRHAQIRALSQGRAVTRQLRSIYFDTPGLALARQGIGLRVRRIGGRWVQTVKTRGTSAAGLFKRVEVETRVSGDRPEVAEICDPDRRERIERELANDSLEPILETDFRRTSRRLRADGAEILCDLDVGEVRTRAGSTPICELELELVRGNPAALFSVALDLSETVQLRPASRSKFDLGFELLTGERSVPRKASRVDAPPDATLEDVLVAVVGRCLEQLLANAGPARDGVDPEGVHQLRVGIRRLRSALSLFSPLLPREQLAPIREELVWLTGELGPARELDVFLDDVLEPLFRRLSFDPALKELRDAVRELHARSYTRVRQAVDSSRFSRLLLELGRWLAARSWRDDIAPTERELLLAPAKPAAMPLLDQRHAKACKLGARAAGLKGEERHQLRVQLKKLRYASEFLRCVHLAERDLADRYVDRLKELQDTLGRLNDLATPQRILDDVLESMGADARLDHIAAAGLVTGWVAQEVEKAERELLGQWSRLEAAHPFWRPFGPQGEAGT